MDDFKSKSDQHTQYELQKQFLVAELKKNGCRITKQRLLLLDILLQEDCTSCKDIYYHAVRYDKNIGPATIYRMVKLLEDIGAISRKNMYRINYEEVPGNNHLKSSESDENEILLSEENNTISGERDNTIHSSEILCRVQLSDHTVYALTPDRHKEILEEGLSACGYLSDQMTIDNIQFPELNKST